MIETRLLPVPDALSGSLDYVRFARVPESAGGTPGSPTLPSLRASVVLALGGAPGYVRPDGSRYVAPRAAVSFGWDRAASFFPAAGGDFVVLRLSPAGLPGGLGIRGADIGEAPAALEDLTRGLSSQLLKAPVFHVEVNRTASVTIRVYDLVGQPVHEATLGGAPSMVDDGQGPQQAYEHAWQGRIASGVYLYAVTVEAEGHKVVRTGKCAVVR